MKHIEILDIDGNLIHTSGLDCSLHYVVNSKTGIIESLKEKEFALLRKDKKIGVGKEYEFIDGDIEQTFINFRSGEKLMQALQECIAGDRMGPALSFLKHALDHNNSSIHIITARGHYSHDIQNMLLQLSKYSKNHNRNESMNEKIMNSLCFGISNPEFMEYHNIENHSSPARKLFAFKEILEYEKNLLKPGGKITLRYSDDTPSMIEELQHFTANEVVHNPDYSFISEISLVLTEDPINHIIHPYKFFIPHYFWSQI